MTRAASRLGTATEPSFGQLPPEFVDAMNDDLGVPAALAVLHERVTAGNTIMAASDDVGLAAALERFGRCSTFWV